MHAFLVPIRNTSNHEVLQGCVIGDCGDKIELQGVDNGWIRFTNYSVPKEMLLNRFADITADGEYTSLILSSNKRFAFHLAALSGGRVLVASNASELSLISL